MFRRFAHQWAVRPRFSTKSGRALQCSYVPGPDIAMELAWKSRNMDFAMPYLIQALSEETSRAFWVC